MHSLEDETEQFDTDDDDIGNNADIDDDNDLIPDGDDKWPEDPTRHTDSDDDGLADGDIWTWSGTPFNSELMLAEDQSAADPDDDNDTHNDEEDASHLILPSGILPGDGDKTDG